MGKSGSKSKSTSSSSSTSSSDPLTPDELAGYFGKLNTLSGNDLRRFGTRSTDTVKYTPVTNAQIRALGGLGATERRDVNAALDRNLAEIDADPSLSTFQRVRGNQLAVDDARTQNQAISKEVEAAIANLANERAKTRTDVGFQNRELRRNDLLALAEIFFGGKGQRAKSTSTSTGESTSKQKEGFLESLGHVASFGFKF